MKTLKFSPANTSKNIRVNSNYTMREALSFWELSGPRRKIIDSIICPCYQQIGTFRFSYTGFLLCLNKTYNRNVQNLLTFILRFSLYYQLCSKRTVWGIYSRIKPELNACSLIMVPFSYFHELIQTVLASFHCVQSIICSIFLKYVNTTCCLF